VKDLPRLVWAISNLPDHVRLVIVGEGPERETICGEALASGDADHVFFGGLSRSTVALYRTFRHFRLVVAE